MKIHAFDVGTWLFPDSEITADQRKIKLDSPRNSDTCFQILTDLDCPEGTPFGWSAKIPDDGIGVRVYELRPAYVRANSDVKHHDSRNYEEVKDFVIRKAPYEIFDITRPVTDGKLLGGRVAFFVRVDVARDASAGSYTIPIELSVGKENATVEVELEVYKTTLSEAKDSPYSMTHWIYPDTLSRVHGVERGSEEFYRIFEEYLRDLYDMRNNYFQLPTALPIRDESGRITGFDFSENDRIAQICLRLGFRHVYGGFIARFRRWDESDYFLVWDREINTESVEGYRQLKLYFAGVREFIQRNHLEGIYLQGLVDEPQVPNSLTYKALVCTFRTLVPGVKVIDPVETPDIPGSCDIWVIKQAVFEKYKEKYQQLQALGEEYWVYTCGFPANKWMNHVMDLPLSATRLPVWMSVRYGMTGFLHYGYNAFSEDMDTMYDANMPIMFRDELRYFPAGNHGLIYAGKEGFFESVRGNIQRISAAEGELLLRLRKKDATACDKLIDGVCTDFETYTSDSHLIEESRRELLKKLDSLGD